jgi:predicted restriction endonuclease
MSYESDMLKRHNMPSKQEVETALLISLFNHNGTIRDFRTGEQIVDEIADTFNLSEKQRSIQLYTTYQKENRLKRSSLWHRLLFRSADSLAKQNLVSRPSETVLVTGKKEWMLTEAGFDQVLSYLEIPKSSKNSLLTKSIEVQRVINTLVNLPLPVDYDPITIDEELVKIDKKVNLRSRAFRLAVIQEYNFTCAFCGLKINAPDGRLWEVEAAHIVPHSSKGKDDIWNGLALCRLHHWAFDVGWLTIQPDYIIDISAKLSSIPGDYGQQKGIHIFEMFYDKKAKVLLPEKKELYPHPLAIAWHRENKFFT